MYKVVNRKQEIAPFDDRKIYKAIESAYKAHYELDKASEREIELLVEKVRVDLRGVVKNGKVDVEDIQDSIIKILFVNGHGDVAKDFQEYRNQHKNIREINKNLLDYKKLVDSYVDIEDWRVKENSTVSYSLGGLILSNSGAITANYWLSQIYDKEIGDAHRNADYHIHDLSMLSGYCAGWSIKQLIQEGLGGVEGKITSKPAKHLNALCNQMVNFLGILQNEWAGAQAFSSFDTYLAPFVKADNMSYAEVRRAIESFVYGVNTPSRWGSQSPFSNITLDWKVPDDLRDEPAIVGGKFMDFTYGDCQKEADMINKAFLEIMIEGDSQGRGFQYPIPTYSITRDFDWSETENNKLLFEMTAKYGTPYFSNYINSDMDPSDVRSMCPLTGDTEILVKSSKGISTQTIKAWYDNASKRETAYQVWTPEGWADAKPNRQDPTKVYNVKLSNGVVIGLGENHLQPIRGGKTVSAKELRVGDGIPFNKESLITDNLGDYNLGFAIGAYAGDGSHDEDAIIYSLDLKEKDDETEFILTNFWNSFGYPVKVSRLKNVRSVRVNAGAYKIIEQYVKGSNALEKSFSHRIYTLSHEARRGILDGYRATDGSREKKRLYTSSEALRADLSNLISSLGLKYMRNYVDTREGRFGKNPNYRVDFPERSSYGQLYSSDAQFNYYSIVSIEEVENDSYLYCMEVNNQSHLFMLANGLITHNCRLRLDLRELRRKSGGYFGSGESTGSIGVVTINLPRLGYLAKDERDFYARLDNLMDLAARSLDTKRRIVNQLLEQGLYPYTKRYLGTLDNHFSTIGIVGMNEAILNASWLTGDISRVENKQFAIDVLEHMKVRLSDYQEMYDALFNLEATPAESTSYRLAKHDKEKYPNIVTSAAEGTPYYTNSTHLPVNYTEDVFSALDHQDSLQTLYTSGTVFHAFLGEKLPDWKTAAKLVKTIARKYQLPYFTLSPTYSICKNHGYLNGEESTCPHCGEETEVYSRITGYYRPIKNWNVGKQAEYKDRKEYR